MCAISTDVGIQSAASAATVPLAVHAEGVQRIYGSTRALSDGWLQVAVGEIHALLGENGAGKSTLVRILAGLEQPDGGRLDLFGIPVGSRPARSRRDSKIAFIHQDLGLVEMQSVADNIGMTAGYPSRLGLVSDRRLRARARQLFTQLDIDIDVDRLVGELPPAEQAIVAIARALGIGAQLIVLDEPTAKLHAGEVVALFGLLARLRDSGIACLLITHRIDDVLAVCDRVTVLRDGRTVATRPAAGLNRAELVSMIVGREQAIADRLATATIDDQPPALALQAVHGIGFGPVDLQLRPGELTGLTGLADAGHNEVAQLLAGLTMPASGELRIGNRTRVLRSPADALRAGIAYVPADRRGAGLATTLTAAENLFPAGTPGAFWLRHRTERRRAEHILRDFDVRPPEPDRDVDTFSGGNQQKILLARALQNRPDVLVLHDPTAAVDVGARQDIYEQLRVRCARDGCAVLVVTSDLEEATSLCDRTIVMRRGQIVANLARADADLATITERAYGGTA